MSKVVAQRQPTIEVDNPMVIIGQHSLVYRLFADDGTLLYVGSSEHIADRLGVHERSQPWWADVAVVRLEEYADFESMRAAEWKIIEDETPLHNVQGRPKPRAERVRGKPGRPVIGRKMGPFPVPEEMRARLDAHAQDHGVTLAETVRLMLADGLASAGY